MSADGYRLIKWERVCDQCPAIEAAHDRASEGAEYGINFHEFINTADGLGELAAVWWTELPKERRMELLRERERDLTGLLEALKQEIKLEETT